MSDNEIVPVENRPLLDRQRWHSYFVITVQLIVVNVSVLQFVGSFDVKSICDLMFRFPQIDCHRQSLWANLIINYKLFLDLAFEF